MKVLITGATGFIGRELCRKLAVDGFDLRLVVRNNNAGLPVDAEIVKIVDINESTDWQKALAGVDVVVHLAAIAHITGKKSVDLMASEIRKVNVEGVRCLALACAKAGVQRFIFISSVKVNGEGADLPYNEDDAPAPQDLYGKSKQEAEEFLAEIASQTGLKIVILRPPLVYGVGVKANFRNLIRLAGIGLPLPFKGIYNRRSFIYIGNFVDAISRCITHPKAIGETFLVSDDEDISTPDLIRTIALAMGKKPLLFFLPQGFLRGVLGLVGKSQEMDKLTGSLCVNCHKIKDLLGWTPPFTLKDGIKQTVKGV